MIRYCMTHRVGWFYPQHQPDATCDEESDFVTILEARAEQATTGETVMPLDDVH